MSITIDIDETIWRAAEDATDIHDPAELIHQLLQREVERRAVQRRLAAAGGSFPGFEVAPRQRPGTEMK